MKQIAIIGAGISGITLARALSTRAGVTLFEKSRGVGGRIATRRAKPYQFDHGAQFFTAKTHAFQTLLAPLVKQGVVAPWHARFVEYHTTDAHSTIVQTRTWQDTHPHYVGAPNMNAMAKHLADGLDVRLSTQIQQIKKNKIGNSHLWQLHDTKDVHLGEFDWVVSTAPASQTKALLPTDFAYHSRLANIHMQGCFSLMLGFDTSLALPWDAALIKNADISWISVNSSKPDRNTAHTCLLVHSTNNWADVHMEDNKQAVIEHLHTATARTIGEQGSMLQTPSHIDLHRWRYANISKQQAHVPLIDQAVQLAACGDWCTQGRIEAAFISATHTADALLQMM